MDECQKHYFFKEYIFVILFIWNQEHIKLFWGNLNWNVTVYDWEIEARDGELFESDMFQILFGVLVI